VRTAILQETMPSGLFEIVIEFRGHALSEILLQLGTYQPLILP
jgi:hypothetical protein